MVKSTKFKNKTILLVEDSAPINFAYKEKLIEKGANVINAFNGKEGLDILKKEKVNLVLSDIMMPKMNGIEMLKIIKSDNLIKHIPVIILTNLGDRSKDVKNCKELGAYDYMVKANTSLEDLIKKIKEVI